MLNWISSLSIEGLVSTYSRPYTKLNIDFNVLLYLYTVKHKFKIIYRLQFLW